MSDYDSAVQKMRERQRAREQIRYQEDMATLINAIAKADKFNQTSFYIDTILCNDVLKVAEKDFHITYYVRQKYECGRIDSILTTNIRDADSIRLKLKKDQSDAKTEKPV